jgi:hypothetical protein
VKRRLSIVLATTLALLFGGSTAATALFGNTTSATGDWGCVVVRTVNQGVCLSNPLPERLPLPN